MTKEGMSANNSDLAMKMVGFSVASMIFLFLIYRLKVLLICIVLALTLSAALSPIVESAQRKKIPRIVTVLLLYVLAALIYGLVAALLIPAICEQWHKLLENLPAYISGIDRWYQKVLSFAGNKPDVFVYEVGDLKTLLPKLLRQTLDMSAGVLGLVLNVVLILFLAGYFAVEADQIWRNTLKWLPENARDRFAKLIAPLSMRLGGYVRGELLVALAVGTFLAIGFAILGLKYALLLGVLGGILNLFPYVGALAATACAVIVAFNQSPALALGVLLFYGLEQWVESSFLVPNLLGKSVALHPLIVLLSILCGASLMGIPGALVSVPITSAAMLIAEEFYLKRSGANDK